VDMHGADGNMSGEADEMSQRTDPREYPRQSRRRCMYIVININNYQIRSINFVRHNPCILIDI